MSYFKPKKFPLSFLLLWSSSSSSSSLSLSLGSKGWRSGESTRLPPMWPGFKSPRWRHMWVEFVVGSLPCSKTFFCGYSGFLLSSKTNISKFQFDQESGRQRTTLWMCYLQIIIYLLLFIYYSSSPLLFSTPKSKQLTFKCCLARYCTCSGFYCLLVSWPSFKNCPRKKKTLLDA